MRESLDTVVIGGGHAGLSISYFLTDRDREHIVLERGRVGETWRSRRWDSFTLVTPNWMNQLPGFQYDGPDPEGYLPRDDISGYMEDYVRTFSLPVRPGVAVTALKGRSQGDGYTVQTGDGSFDARNVVVATGAFQLPKIPGFSAEITQDVHQIASNDYRNPDTLPDGKVLVVGSGQSGCQIAEELSDSGRDVFLCTSGCGWIPRRYRGQDTTWWWAKHTGRFEMTVDQLESPAMQFACNPQATGKNGGHDINLRLLAGSGVILLGRLAGARGTVIELGSDLQENVRKSDEFAAKITKNIDEAISKAGIDAPKEEISYDSDQASKLGLPSYDTLDLKWEGINTIIWAIGFDLDHSWVDLPVIDDQGRAVHKRGVTEQPGLYFLGLHFQHTAKSDLFFGIGEDAEYIADSIETRY